MIYITGDLHAPIDISKLNTKNFPIQKILSKDDYIIVTGDCGIVWDGSKEDLYWQKWLNDKNFTFLWIDGNHEGFHLLNQYPISQWHGGKVHFIQNSVIHLMRGQVFTINGLKFFTMGGATSIDKYRRIEGKSWWKEEMPSQEEYDEAMSNLDRHNWMVDYVITHDCSTRIKEYSSVATIKEYNLLNKFFDMLEDDLKFKHWYFGHYHNDMVIDEKHTLVYNQIVKLKGE